MHFSEYIEYDAVGLAHLIKSGQVSTQEVQQLARQAISGGESDPERTCRRVV